MNRFLCVRLMIACLLILLTDCTTQPRDNSNGDTSLMGVTHVTSKGSSPTRYDFFIENSGSVKGFFNGDTNAKTIIRQFYDRIDEQNTNSDTITLNFINNTIVPFKRGIVDFIQNAYANCNQGLSKLDEILDLAIDNSLSGNVSLLMSDYCFESNTGNFLMAKSGITRTFTKKLNNSDVAIAIFKFNSHFKGRYFPGGINCDQELPFYIWVFGPSEKVKKIVELPNIQMEESFILQPAVYPQHSLVTNQARIKGPEGSVNVSKWKGRRGYKLSFEYDISNVILPKSSITDKNNYSISEDYDIDSIELSDNICKMTIKTNKPYPGVLLISYNNVMPDWVEESNFEGTGIPPEGQTLGIRYLIEGVYDAFKNKSSSIYEIKIIMNK